MWHSLFWDYLPLGLITVSLALILEELFRRRKSTSSELNPIYLLSLATALLAAVLFMDVSKKSDRPTIIIDKPTPTPVSPDPTPTRHKKNHGFTGGKEKTLSDIAKDDCQHFVEGQLVFSPSATMRQGQTYVVSARLSRGADEHITLGLDGTLTIENTQVSCMVSMTLDSQGPNAFTVDKVPAGRKDEQVLLLNKYTQWDWRVTPLKSGTLHLLLYVTPMLYVDGMGQGLKEFPQPARVITVSPDRMYAFKNFVVGNWAVWGSLLTAIIIPLFLWLLRAIKSKREKTASAKKAAGFRRL